jgi:hypothetical protein
VVNLADPPGRSGSRERRLAESESPAESSFNIFQYLSPSIPTHLELRNRNVLFDVSYTFTSVSVSVFISKTDSLLLSKYALALDE